MDRRRDDRKRIETLKKVRVFNADSPEGRQVRIVAYSSQEKIGGVVTACPRENWFNLYVKNAKGKAEVRRFVRVAYRVVDKRTGIVVQVAHG
jgi:hypothetical protein